MVLLMLQAVCTRVVSPAVVLVAVLWGSRVCLLCRVALVPSRVVWRVLVLVRCLWLWVARWCWVLALCWCCVRAAAPRSARRVRMH